MADTNNRGARQHVAILHFTAPPHIGGVESLIAAQTRFLLERGHQVRLLVAAGTVTGADVRHLPLLHPADPRVLAATRALAGNLPEPDHPLVTQIEVALARQLKDLDQCWVHNAFTVFLNPFLSVALPRLVERLSRLRWVNWCEDLSSISRYWPEMSAAEKQSVTLPPGVKHVAISATRQAELAVALNLPLSTTAVIHPPFELASRLDLSPEILSTLSRSRLLERDPVIFVPEKLLPHKNLELAVDLTAALRSRSLDPLTLISGADSPHDPATSTRVHAALSQRADELGISDHVEILARTLGRPPSHQAMRELMLLADLVFLPSIEEGYGMPVLEAAALRVPVLCADIPAFREAGGSGAHYFSLGDSPASIADAAATIYSSHTNVARRAAVRSWQRFEHDLDTLLASSLKIRDGSM